MKKSLVIFILLTIFLSCGCFIRTRINQVMASWVNHPIGDLIASWGPPQQIFDDGYGGRILVYLSRRTFVRPGTATTTTVASARIYDNYILGTGTSYTTFTPSSIYGYTAYRMFWINQNGVVYRWAWRGL